MCIQRLTKTTAGLPAAYRRMKIIHLNTILTTATHCIMMSLNAVRCREFTISLIESKWTSWRIRHAHGCVVYWQCNTPWLWDLGQGVCVDMVVQRTRSAAHRCMTAEWLILLVCLCWAVRTHTHTRTHALSSFINSFIRSPGCQVNK